MEFEFPADGATIESLTAVPTHFQPWFEKSGEGYALKADYRPHGDQFNGLTRNLKTTRTSLTKVNKESADRRGALSAFEGIIAALPEDKRTADGLAAHLQDLETRAAAGGKKGEEAARQIENIKTEMAKSHAVEVGKWKSQTESLETEINSYLVDNVAMAEIMALKGVPQLLMPVIKGRVKVQKGDDGKRQVVVLNDKGEARFNGSGDPLSIADYVKELQADATYGRAFEKSVKDGGGTQPGKNKTTPAARSSERTEGESNRERMRRGLEKRQKEGTMSR
jgi:hypothetical protein